MFKRDVLGIVIGILITIWYALPSIPRISTSNVVCHRLTSTYDNTFCGGGRIVSERIHIEVTDTWLDIKLRSI